MKKVLGITIILALVMGATALSDRTFLTGYNLSNIAKWTGLFGILAIGAAFVIISGGIDLSIGSVVGLCGVLLPIFLKGPHLSAGQGMAAVLGVSLAIGLAHGLLITKLRLQPFVVTLCGLFIYRGLARFITGDATQGFGADFQGLKAFARAAPLGMPMPMLQMIVIGLLAAFVLNRTIWGRYLLALGRNETAARYSGIETDRMVILAYVISAGLAGYAGMLFALDLNSVQPSTHGNFYELYAIAGAVLGGCSLRGGEGSILGVVIGTALVRVLLNVINIRGIPSQLEFAVVGVVILLGVMIDEGLRRFGARRARSAG